MPSKTNFNFDPIEVKSNVEIAAQWRVPADLVYLNGHFPGQPVVPAVAIIDAAFEVLKVIAGPAAKLTSVKNAKFTSPLLPEQTVSLECKQVVAGDWSVDLKTETPEGVPQAIAKLLLTLA